MRREKNVQLEVTALSEEHKQESYTYPKHNSVLSNEPHEA